MPDLKDFALCNIDWNLTPEHAVTMYLEWGNNDWHAEYPPVRSKEDVSHYFVVDSWQDPPVVRLVRRNSERADDLISVPLPDSLLADSVRPTARGAASANLPRDQGLAEKRAGTVGSFRRETLAARKDAAFHGRLLLRADPGSCRVAALHLNCDNRQPGRRSGSYRKSTHSVRRPAVVMNGFVSVRRSPAHESVFPASAAARWPG